MIKYLQRRYALSRKGAIDNIKGILCCALQNISFMLPVGLLYRLVSDMMNGTLTTGRIPFYVIGCVAAALFIVVCTRLEYDNTFLVTYVESGVRRVGLAEKLRKIPLSFFGRKDLADLTTSIMNDCAVLEQSQSHFVAPLYGAILSTTVIAVSMLFFNWRMALGRCPWHLPSSCLPPTCRKSSPAKQRRQRSPARTAFRSVWKRCPICAPITPRRDTFRGWKRKSVP
jgi:ATP-binding cassette subfamily B protein IrtB